MRFGWQDISALLPVLIPAILVPLALFVLNWGLRHKQGYEQTAGSDFLLALLVFDMTVIAASETFAPLVSDSELRKIVTTIHIGLFCLGLIFWVVVVVWAEQIISAAYDRFTSAYTNGIPIKGILLAWCPIFALVGLHVLVYLAKRTA